MIIIIIVIAMCSEENGIIKRSRGWEQTPRKLRWISYFSPLRPFSQDEAVFLAKFPRFYKAATWGLPSRRPGGQVNHLICQLSAGRNIELVTSWQPSIWHKKKLFPSHHPVFTHGPGGGKGQKRNWSKFSSLPQFWLRKGTERQERQLMGKTFKASTPSRKGSQSPLPPIHFNWQKD